MAFPDLTLMSGGHLHASATGTPANGTNTFALAIDPSVIDNPDWIVVDVYQLGPSVTGASNLVVSGDKTTISIDFVQTGADQARVEARLEHSISR